MPTLKMTNPHDALLSFQKALANNAVQLQKCALYDDLYVHLDRPMGNERFTYALIRNRTVRAYAIIVVDDPVEGVPCFGVGYAVAKNYRKQGLGYQVVEKSLSEFINGMKPHIPKFYFESIVGEDNLGSQRISEKYISSDCEKIIDSVSGLPAFHYLKLVE